MTALSDDLRSLYERPANSFVARGDQVDGEAMLGLAIDGQAWADGERSCRLLLAGDESLAEPPPRPVPTRTDEENGVEIIRSGPHPAQRLAPEMLRPTSDVYPGMPEAFERELSDQGKIGLFLRSLMDEIREPGHQIWLVGGAVRDMVGDGTGATINDLDFSGTTPPDELYELLERLLPASDLGDYFPAFSDQSLVVSVAPLVGGDRIVEYKPLEVAGFRFPAFDGDLADDAAFRDLTVNSLYYDHHQQIVLDPSGVGIDHVRARPRRLATRFDGPGAARLAGILLRFLKFHFRWTDSDTSEFSEWAAALPADLASGIAEREWDSLVKLWRRCVPKSRRIQALDVAQGLGPAAAGVLQGITERTR